MAPNLDRGCDVGNDGSDQIWSYRSAKSTQVIGPPSYRVGS